MDCKMALLSKKVKKAARSVDLGLQKQNSESRSQKGTGACHAGAAPQNGGSAALGGNSMSSCYNKHAMLASGKR